MNTRQKTMTLASAAFLALSVACQDQTNLTEVPGLSPKPGHGGGGGPPGGGPDANMDWAGGVVAAVQGVNITHDNNQRLLAAQDPYTSRENLVNTAVLFDTSRVYGPLDPGGPTCSLPSDFHTLVAPADTLAVLNALRDRLLAASPAASAVQVDIDKGAVGAQSVDHFFKIQSDDQLVHLGKNGGGGFGYWLKARLISGDPNDPGTTRVFDLSEGIARTLVKTGPKKKDPVVNVYCWNMDTITVTIAPLP